MNLGDDAWKRRSRGTDEASLEKSAYVLFIEFCSDTMIQTTELSTIVRIPGRKLSVFHLRKDKAAMIARVTGIEPSHWERARGAAYLADRVGKYVFLDELRYCRECLSMAHHSVLFQLTQVMNCPVHKRRLEMGCPHCGRPIPTDLMSLARHHMYCGHCGRTMAQIRSRASSVEPMEHPSALLFEPLRRALQSDPLSGECRSTLPWTKCSKEVVASSTLVRRHHLHQVWGSHAIGLDFLNVRTSSVLLGPEDPLREVPTRCTPMYRRTITALEELAERLAPYASVKCIPQGALGTARVDEALSSIAAAYWQTAKALGAHEYLSGAKQKKWPWFWSAWFQPWLPVHWEALTEVIQGMVHTLFSLYLIRASRLRYGVQVDWNSEPSWHQYLPPWRMVPRSGTTQVELQVRARADKLTVVRLASRYRGHVLDLVPEGVSPLALINE